MSCSAMQAKLPGSCLGENITKNNLSLGDSPGLPSPLSEHPCFPFLRRQGMESTKKLTLGLLSPAPSLDLGGHNQLLHCHSIPMHMRKPFPMQVGGKRRPSCHISKLPQDLHGWAQREEDGHVENTEGESASWLLQEKHHQVR